MSTATLDIFNVATAKFKTDIATPESLSTSYPNEVVPPPGNVLHARVSVLTGDSVQVTSGATGSQWVETIGDVTVSLFGPLNRGVSALVALADKIVTAFTTNTDSGVTFQVPSVIILGEISGEWQVNVVCPWYYREQV